MSRPRRRGRDVHGVLLLDKPQGASSNDVLQKVKRIFNANRAGHTGALDPLATQLPPSPIQNALMGPVRRAAAKAGDADGMALWAGQGVGAVRALPAAELMHQLVAELARISLPPVR